MPQGGQAHGLPPFLTKEALFVEALEAILAKLKAKVSAIARDQAPAAERLTAIVAVMFGEIGRLKALIRVAEGSGERPGEAGRAVLRRELRHLRGEIAAVIRDGGRSGSFAPVDPDLAAMVVLGGVRMAADSGSDDPAEAVAALLLGGLVHRVPHRSTCNADRSDQACVTCVWPSPPWCCRALPALPPTPGSNPDSRPPTRRPAAPAEGPKITRRIGGGPPTGRPGHPRRRWAGSSRSRS